MELFGDFIRMQLLVVIWGIAKFPDCHRKIWKNLLVKIELYNFLPELQILLFLQFENFFLAITGIFPSKDLLHGSNPTEFLF